MLALDNIEGAIRMLKDEHEELFSESTAPLITMYPPLSRPFSMVARVRLEWDDGSKWVYVKVPFSSSDPAKTEGIYAEYMQLKWFYEKLPVESGYSVVRPLQFYDEYNALITEEAEGTVLDDMIKKHGKFFNSSIEKLAPYFTSCGEWLREFQLLPVPPFCKPYLADKALEDVKDLVRMCYDDGLLEKELLHAISSFAENTGMGSGLIDYRLVPMHSDFIPSNIIVRDGVVTVLDFFDDWSGPACRDVITILLTLDGCMVNPLFRPDMIEGLKSEFLKGYRLAPNEERGLLYRLFEVREILCKTLQLSMSAVG